MNPPVYAIVDRKEQAKRFLPLLYHTPSRADKPLQEKLVKTSEAPLGTSEVWV
jgi:hypothetical protein